MRSTHVVAAAVSLATVVAVGPAAPAAHANGYARPILTITTDKAAYREGQTARVTIRIQGPNYAYVDLFSTPPGRQANWLGNETLGYRDEDVVDVVMTATTTLSVSYDGTQDYSEVPSVASTPVIPVSGSMSTRLSGGYATSHDVRLVRAGNAAKLAVAIAAAQEFSRIYVPVQVRRDGAWRTTKVLSAQLRPAEIDDQPSNTAAVTFGGTPGTTYRVRGEFRGDAFDDPETGGWWYVRFV